jgi:osmoprotectant transport system ATP-binding protein
VTETHGLPIRLEKVTKLYPGSDGPAVEEVTLEVPAGEVAVLVGPSGCGKTTTMKMINRLIEPTSGTIHLGDTDVTKSNPDVLRRGIGYVIQQIGLFPHMTVADNVAVVPRLLRWDRSRIADRVDELLGLVGLDPDDFRHRYPRQLSGGQQQRVGVARALAVDPPVMLMDEPFGAVDPITRSRLQDELLALQSKLHKTIVFVTHDFDEAIKLGDRIAVLRERSQIAQYDTPAAILAEPADDFVAGFVGHGATLKQLALYRVSEVELVPTDDTSIPEIGQKATLADALDAMLAEGADQLAVVGTDGERLGGVTLDTVLATMRELRDRAAETANGGTPSGRAGVKK